MKKTAIRKKMKIWKLEAQTLIQFVNNTEKKLRKNKGFQTLTGQRLHYQLASCTYLSL